MRAPSPVFWLPLVMGALCLVFSQPLPLIDEESYLDIAGQIQAHPLRPYDWWRAWQPWGSSPVDNAFVFAHPPLHLWFSVLALALGRLAALPLALLYGLSAGVLAQRCSRRPQLAAGLMLASPVVLLALQASLMIDLGVVALSTAAVAAWVMVDDSPKWHLVAGVLLGAAASWKYPALVLLPVFLIHAWRRMTLRETAPFWAGFALVFGGVQALLYAQYGQIHLLHVLSTASEIGRGPLSGRALGTLFRMGLLVAPVVLLRRPWMALPGALAVLFVDLDGGQLSMALLGVLGLGALIAAVRALREDDLSLLCGLWVLAVVAGVVLGHNYVGGRYLLPAVVPLALVVSRGLPARAEALLVPWVALGLAMVIAERSHAQVSAELVQALGGEGHYTGEWTARWAFEEAGWERWEAGDPLESGARLAVPSNGSPAPLPPGLIPEQTVEGGHFPLRLIDLDTGIGYHAETLGPRPFGFSAAPMERVVVYRVP